MDLVFLSLEPPEKAADPVVASITLDDERPLIVGQLRPRCIETNAGFAGSAFQLRQLRAIVRLDRKSVV